MNIEWLDDPKRRRIRKRSGASLFDDFVFRSETSDYKTLRTVVNSLLGLILCTLIYYLGWEKLNFADFSIVYGTLFQLFMIFSCVYVFVLSPLFRCALFCVLMGALGKNGQAPLTMFVMNNIQDGPMKNIIANYKLTAEIVVCHLELQARIISNRISMFTGPMEEMLEKQLTLGLKILKKATSFVKKLISPFMSELTPKKTKEDEMYDWNQKQLQILAQRQELGLDPRSEESEDGNLTVKGFPLWTNFKSEFGRRIAERMAHKCNQIFDKGVEKCREIFTNIQKKCYDVVPFGLSWYACSKLNMDDVCQSIGNKRKSISICNDHFQEAHVGSSMEDKIKEVVNLTESLDKEMDVNIHMVAVENSRDETDYSLVDVKLMVKHGMQYIKTLMRSMKQVISGLFIVFVYKIFKDAVKMINNYKADIEYNNCFVGNIFWRIDQERHEKGEMALLHLDHSEMKKWNILPVFGWPTKQEMRAVKGPFLVWVMLTLIVITVVVVDQYLYFFLNKIVTSTATISQPEESAKVEVQGDGIVAEFLRDMININETVDVEHALSNEHCLTPPVEPDMGRTAKFLFIPLLLSLVMQVIFSFVLKRTVINFVLPFMFPRRDRARIIYLYNKLLFLRAKNRSESRAKIRFVATRWKINIDHDEGGWLSNKSWIKKNVLDRVFRTGQCIMCETYMRPRSLICCDKCPATYCKFCKEELEDDCYACQAQAGEVTSERSQKLSISDSKLETTSHQPKGS